MLAVVLVVLFVRPCLSRRGSACLSIRGGGTTDLSTWRRPVDLNKQRRAPPVERVIRLDEFLDRNSRVAFVRRVYGLLSGSLGVSVVACLLCASNPRATILFASSPVGRALLGAAMAAGLGVPLALSFPKLRHNPGVSLPLFGIFTLAESFLLGVASSAFDFDTVFLALTQTTAAVLALTLYAFQPNPRYDLTGLGSSFFVALIVLLATGLLAGFYDVPGIKLAYSAFGAILFSLFIVRDTELVVGGEKKNMQFDTRDYVMAAVTLYLDIANLFLFLLRIASNSSSDSHAHRD